MEKLQGRREKAYYDFLNSFIVEILIMLLFVIDLSVTNICCDLHTGKTNSACLVLRAFMHTCVYVFKTSMFIVVF